MPLPWLIGIAAVAAVAAVAKAISDDDDSSNTSDSERYEQERDAKLVKKRQSLKTQLENLQKNQLTLAHDTLVSSAKVLGKNIKIIHRVQNKENLQSALKSQLKSKSEYARNMIFLINLNKNSCVYDSNSIANKLLTNFNIFDSLFLRIDLNDSERADIKNMQKSVSRLKRLQKLKKQLELQE